MVVLHCNMQEDNIIKHTSAKCHACVMCLKFNMEKEYIIEHTSFKCHVFTIHYARGKC